jgi:hypothetical protein
MKMPLPVVAYLWASLFLVSIVSCKSTISTSQSQNMSKTVNDHPYVEITEGKSVVNFVDRKVWFTGKESTIIYQHMMKSPGLNASGERLKEDHAYIDYNNGGQIVAYYHDISFPEDKAVHKFYGTIRSMSGAGKGGGTHTEYYLMLDKVE